eukprot:SAG31_NODE_24550_length_479_cov_0.781579_1_plen_70_part_10
MISYNMMISWYVMISRNGATPRMRGALLCPAVSEATTHLHRQLTSWGEHQPRDRDTRVSTAHLLSRFSHA